MDVKSRLSAIFLFTRWSVVGLLTALILGLVISWIITPRDPNAGDGILILAVMVLLLPLGAALGIARASTIWRKRNLPRSRR
jgi:hypothetical protein